MKARGHLSIYDIIGVGSSSLFANRMCSVCSQSVPLMGVEGSLQNFPFLLGLGSGWQEDTAGC